MYTRTRALSAALVGVFALTTGCGSDDAEDVQTEQQQAQQEQTEQQQAEGTAEETQEELDLDLSTATQTEIAEALEAGEATSEQLVEAYLDRIEALDRSGPGLNSVRMINPDALEDAAALDQEREEGENRGPLHGVPILLKDNIDVAGMPTTAGSVALADSVPEEDSPLVTELREAGAVILGKTNLSEFAYFMTSGAPSGYSSLGGQVLNAYDNQETPSGSSSGSGVAMAAALAANTVGTETSGSILSPSQANSVVGVKPTVGSISRTGVIPISASQDTAGPMSRSVADAAALMDGMVGTDEEDEATAENPLADTGFLEELDEASLDGARIGVIYPQPEEDEEYGGFPAFEESVEVLEEQGADVVEIPALADTEAEGILVPEFKRDLNAYLDRLPEEAPMDSLADIIEFNEEHSEAALKYGQTLLEDSEDVDLDDPEQLQQYESDLEQGLQDTRAAIDGALEEHEVDAIVSDSATTGIGARAGYPSVSVPNGYEEHGGHPTALVFLGTEWTDAQLLSYAYSFEQAADAWRSPAEVNRGLFRCTIDAVDEFPGDCPAEDDEQN